MLQLRQYQERSLDALEGFLRLATQRGAQTAFNLQTNRSYLAVKQLPGLPYVCLRIPTGGGKTLMACHAVGIAANTFLQAERAVCLWLVPSNTIREQTLAALRDREHPYRQAIDSQFAGQVRAMDLMEALYVQRSTLDGETVVIVSTLAALRVEDTDGRKVYEPCGALSHHFSGLDASLEAMLEKREDGTIPHSLANVLRLWRPLVVMDEAHNARTRLSFDTLARFSPSCIIEFTATPATSHNPERESFASNVLHHVSAAELKAEDMVKLPIKLRTRGDWKEVVAEAVEMQRALERCANEEEKQTGEYIRPIVLLQAQPRSQERLTLTVEVVKKTLIEDFKIPEEQVAIATGQIRGIADVNLLERSCPLRFIITVQALKEGWDCPFAYVLCSVAEISSSRAVEQILGRVLRLPQARRKQKSELNCAYAFAASPRFIDAATALKDALVENGFQQLEANQLITAQEQAHLFDESALFAHASEPVSQKPDLTALDEAIRQRVTYEDGTRELTVTGALSHGEMETLKACFIAPEDRAAVERIYHVLQGHAVGPAPSGERRTPFRVPLLGIRVDGHLEIFEESCFKDIEWRLADCDAALSDVEFPTQEAAGEAGEVDVSEAGLVEIRFIDQLHEQLTLLNAEQGWDVASLVNWLDRAIPHPDITQAQAAVFIHNLVRDLVVGRGLTVEQLARQKFRLCNAIEAKIAKHRDAQARSAYNGLLFGAGKGSIEVTPDLCFEFEEGRYSPNLYYEGNFNFRRHYFRNIGELEAKGEEFECAVFIDNLPQIAYWVRNLGQRSDSSFWLQTSTDRFYPDFVALLKDGRILVVEYKGADRWSNDDSKEKRALGELWMSRSENRCLFVMPKGPNWEDIRAAIERPSKWALAADDSLFH